jgi:hypothetical protein
MKKLFLLAALAAVTQTSCLKGGESIPDGQSRLVVRIDGLSGGSSRKVEAPGTVSITSLSGTNHYIYVLNSDNTVEYGEPLDPAKLSSGQTIGENMFFANTSKVYVLANIPSNLSAAYTYDQVADFDALKALTSAISYVAPVANTDHKNPAMANTTGAPVQVGAATAGVATVSVNIAPLYSRIELESVKGGAHIESFDVTAVYLDNYYSSFTLDGKSAGALKSNGSLTTFAPEWFGDVSTVSSASNIATAGSGMVWAYNAAPGVKVPTIIVKLENIRYYYDDGNGSPTGSEVVLAGARYLTISDYRTGVGVADPMYSGTFERGKIFKIKPVTFDHVFSNGANPDDDEPLPETPNPDAVQIRATVVVDNWGIQTLYPVLGE